MLHDLVIIGSGGSAREIAWLASDCQAAGAPVRPVAFVDDARAGEVVNDLPVWDRETAMRRGALQYVIGLGDPRARAEAAVLADAAGWHAATLVHPTVVRAPSAVVGPGTTVATGSVLSVNTALGAHVQVNLACTISHDVHVGDYATLSPGVRLCGWVSLDAHAFIGAGAVVLEGTHRQRRHIGAFGIVGAGAVVRQDVEARTTVVGVPARRVGEAR